MDEREKRKLTIEPEHILFYLQTNELPLHELHKRRRQRRHFKQRASEFIIEDDKLFFIRPTYQRVSAGKVHRIPQKRLVLFSNEDKLQAFYECHLNKIGDHTVEHNGIVKTSELFSKKYYVPFHYQMMDKLRKNCPTCCGKTSDKLEDDITILNQLYGEKDINSVLDVGGCPQGKSTSGSHKGSTSAIPIENEMHFDSQDNSVSNEEDERGENYEDGSLGSNHEDHNYVVKRSNDNDSTGKDADEDEIAGKYDEDEITGKDEDNIAGKDDDEITGKDAYEGDIAGKDANEDEIAGKDAEEDDMTVKDADEDEIAEKDANEDDIAGKDEDDIAGKDEDDIAGKNEDEDEITGKDANEDDIAGKDAEEDDITVKDADEDEIAEKDANEDDIAGKDEDDIAGKNEDEDEITGKDANEDDIAGKDAEEDDMTVKDADEDEIAEKDANEDDIVGKDEDDIAGKNEDEDEITGKDANEDDIAGKDAEEDDMTVKDADDIAGKDKDEDEIIGKDEDDDDIAGKDEDVLTMIQRDQMADEHTNKTDMRTTIEPKEPAEFWHSVEVCVFGPYDHWGKKKYVLVFLDLYSMWPEVMVVDTLSPTIVTMSLLNLVCRYHIMKKLYLKESKRIPLSSYTPDIELLKSADLNLDIIIHSNRHYTDHLWRAMRNHVSNYIGNNVDWPQSLSFAFIPLRMTDEDGSYKLFINNKREIEDKFVLKERFSSFEECQEKLLKAYRSCSGNSMNSNDNSKSSGSNANTSVLRSILSPNQKGSNSDLAKTNVIHDEVPIHDCNNQTTVMTRQNGNIDIINTTGTWPYYTTDVQKRQSTETSGNTEESTRPDNDGSLQFVESLSATPNDEIANTKTALARKSDIKNILKAQPTNQRANSNVICTRSSSNPDIKKTENTALRDNSNFKSHIPDFKMTRSSKSKTLSVSPLPSKDKITINTPSSAKRKRLTDVSSENDCEKSAKKKLKAKRQVIDAVIGKSDKFSKNILQNGDNDGIELLTDALNISDDFKVCNTTEDSSYLLSNCQPTVALKRLPISTENTVSVDIDDAITPKVRRTDKDKSLSCYICKLTFKHFKELKYHMQSHFTTKRVKCGKCGRIFCSQYSLRRHEDRLHNDVKPYGLRSCQKVVQSRELRNTHQGYHREYGTSLCLICGKRLKTISMESHMRLHSDVIIFNCRQCSRNFTTEVRLNTHIAFKHANARPPNECPVCKKKYITKASMEYHFKTRHQNMKTFLCDKYGKRICRKENNQTTCVTSTESEVDKHMILPRNERKTGQNITIPNILYAEFLPKPTNEKIKTDLSKATDKTGNVLNKNENEIGNVAKGNAIKIENNF